MFAIFKREVRSSFHGMIGYVLTAFLLAASAIYFVALNLGYGLPDFGYYTLLPHHVLCCCSIIPVLTMRSFAEERRTRTDQLLLTSPVSVWEIVLGKFFALCVVFALPCVCRRSHDPCTWRTGCDRGQYAGQFCGAAVLLSAGLRRHCHRCVSVQPDRESDHRCGGRCGGAAAGLSDAQPAQHVHHRQRRGAGLVHRTCRSAQCGGGPAYPQLYVGLLDLCGCCVVLTVLFLLRSSWLTEAFSVVLSALCLFARRLRSSSTTAFPSRRWCTTSP